jgi:hypothetical protein
VPVSNVKTELATVALVRIGLEKLTVTLSPSVSWYVSVVVLTSVASKRRLSRWSPAANLIACRRRLWTFLPKIDDHVDRSVSRSEPIFRPSFQ